MIKTFVLSLLFVSIAPASIAVGELINCNGCLTLTYIASQKIVANDTE